MATVKQLKEWLNEKNDNDEVCELEEYGFANPLSIELLTTRPVITFIKTAIEPVERKMDFGKIMVCSKCGKGRIPSCQEIIDKTYKACCEDATLISLKKYTEEVKGVAFDNSKWSFSCKDINLIKDIDLNAEVRVNGINTKGEQ